MFPIVFLADRRRPEPPAFVDTVPAWFRSEAFVEDLPPAPPLLPARAPGLASAQNVQPQPV